MLCLYCSGCAACVFAQGLIRRQPNTRSSRIASSAVRPPFPTDLVGRTVHRPAVFPWQWPPCDGSWLEMTGTAKSLRTASTCKRTPRNVETKRLHSCKAEQGASAASWQTAFGVNSCLEHVRGKNKTLHITTYLAPSPNKTLIVAASLKAVGSIYRARRWVGEASLKAPSDAEVPFQECNLVNKHFSRDLQWSSPVQMPNSEVAFGGHEMQPRSCTFKAAVECKTGELMKIPWIRKLFIACLCSTAETFGHFGLRICSSASVRLAMDQARP